MSISIRAIRPADRRELAALIHSSTNAYYASIGRDPIFAGPPEEAAIFPDVYDALDPGQGLAAVDDETGAIVGSCFVHPRDTHVSLGIMNVAADQFGRGIARKLLARIIDDAAPRPVRLVSSCLNLASFSLYSRAGFEPRSVVQDVLINVPEEGLPPCEIPHGLSLRDATLADADAITTLFRETTGLDRRRDVEYLLSGTHDVWSMSVATQDAQGRHGGGDIFNGGPIVGAVASCGSAAVNMIGPGAAVSESAIIPLVRRELNRHRGRSPVVLVPSSARDLLEAAAGWGGRNVELHVIQSNTELSPVTGVELPTFLPE